MKRSKSEDFQFEAEPAKMKLNILLHTIFLCTVNTTFMLTGILLNSVVVLCFWRSSKLRNRLEYLMIAVLACFDLAVVIVMHPLIMLSAMAWLFQKLQIFHTMNLNASNILCGSSLASLLTMNVERYVALTYPYFYQRVVTRWRLLSVLCFFEVLCLVQSILSYRDLVLNPGMARASILGILFILLLFLNYKIFMIARRMRKTDNYMIASLQWNQENKPPPNILTFKSKPTLKNISTCLFAVTCFFVCCFPALLHNCVSLISKSLLSPDVDSGWGLWANTLVSMNSTFNCLIFFWKNTTLRSEGRNILKGWGIFLTRSNNVDEQNNFAMH